MVTKAEKKKVEEEKEEISEEGKDEDFGHLEEEEETKDESKEDEEVKKEDTDESAEEKESDEDGEKVDEDKEDTKEDSSEDEEPIELDEEEKKDDLEDIDPEDILNVTEDTDEEYEKLPDKTKELINNLREENEKLRGQEKPEEKTEELPAFMKLTSEQLVELADVDMVEYHKVIEQRSNYRLEKITEKKDAEKEHEKKIKDNLETLRKNANKVTVLALKRAGLDPKSESGIMVRKRAASIMKLPSFKHNADRFDGTLNVVSLAILDLLPQILKDNTKKVQKKYGQLKNARPSGTKSSGKRSSGGDKPGYYGQGVTTTKGKYNTDNVEVSME